MLKVQFVECIGPPRAASNLFLRVDESVMSDNGAVYDNTRPKNKALTGHWFAKSHAGGCAHPIPVCKSDAAGGALCLKIR